jgi:hypothetical protein
LHLDAIWRLAVGVRPVEAGVDQREQQRVLVRGRDSGLIQQREETFGESGSAMTRHYERHHERGRWGVCPSVAW